MNPYELQYFLLFPPNADGTVLMQPDAATSARKYLSERLLPGKPLRFSNGFADWLDDPDDERIDDLLFDGGSFAIRERLRARLEQFDIGALQLYPMVYAAASGDLHSDYWYANLYEDRDFLDRANAKLMPGIDAPDADYVFVMKYAFNTAAMDAVEEDARLAFRLRGVRNGGFFVHQRVLAALLEEQATGFAHFRVADFSEGMQDA